MSSGGSSRDILIGGAGADRVKGNSDEDILIAGYTAYDTVAGPAPGQLRDQVNLAALAAIQAAWAGPGTAAARVADIRAGTGALAGTGFHLTATGPDATVQNDDGAADTLTGGQSADWFFVQLAPSSTADTITDKDDSEFVN